MKFGRSKVFKKFQKFKMGLKTSKLFKKHIIIVANAATPLGWQTVCQLSELFGSSAVIVAGLNDPDGVDAEKVEKCGELKAVYTTKVDLMDLQQLKPYTSKEMTVFLEMPSLLKANGWNSDVLHGMHEMGIHHFVLGTSHLMDVEACDLYPKWMQAKNELTNLKQADDEHKGSVKVKRHFGWTILQYPVVLEDLFPLLDPIRYCGEFQAPFGEKQDFSALSLKDMAYATAVALGAKADKIQNKSYHLTGRKSSLKEVVHELSKCLNREISMKVVPSDLYWERIASTEPCPHRMATLKNEFEMWKAMDGKKGPLYEETDHFQVLTNKDPMSINLWIRNHTHLFRTPKSNVLVVGSNEELGKQIIFDLDQQMAKLDSKQYFIRGVPNRFDITGTAELGKRENIDIVEKLNVCSIKEFSNVMDNIDVILYIPSLSSEEKYAEKALSACLRAAEDHGIKKLVFVSTVLQHSWEHLSINSENEETMLKQCKNVRKIIIRLPLLMEEVAPLVHCEVSDANLLSSKQTKYIFSAPFKSIHASSGISGSSSCVYLPLIAQRDASYMISNIASKFPIYMDEKEMPLVTDLVNTASYSSDIEFRHQNDDYITSRLNSYYYPKGVLIQMLHWLDGISEKDTLLESFHNAVSYTQDISLLESSPISFQHFIESLHLEETPGAPDQKGKITAHTPITSAAVAP